jgi:two-component system chemotaxis response regulator CheB
MRPPRSRTQCFELIVLVASLGGLDAISTVLGGLPEDFGTPVLVVQHGRPGFDPQRLATVLRTRTSLPVRTAETGQSAEVAGVTVVPTGCTAELGADRRFTVGECGPFGAGDDVLTSVAAAFGPAAIAVELTGMLRDGADGVRAVKRRGGRVLAQDPETARAGSMPSAAIATGCVDFVLPLGRISSALVALTMAPGAAELLAVPLPPWATPRPRASATR